MAKKKLFSLKELPSIPLGFQHLEKIQPQSEPPPPPKSIYVEKYGTEFYRPSRFYKPISKIT